MQAVHRKLCRHNRKGSKGRRGIDMLFASDESIHRVYRLPPAFIRLFAIVFLYIFRIDGKDRHQDRRDAMGAAFLLDPLQMLDDLFRIGSHTQVIDTAHDQKLFHVKRQHISIKAFLHHLRRVAAPPQIHGRKVQIRHIAVGEIGWTVVEVSPALCDAVTEDPDIKMHRRLISYLFRQAPDTDRLSVAPYPADTPVVCPKSWLLIIDIGKCRHLAPDAVSGGTRTIDILRIFLRHFDFIG